MAKEQLCWGCNRPLTGGCPWMEKGTPVEGWTAKEVPFRLNTDDYTTTYAISACPLFDEQEDYSERERRKCGTYKPPITGERLEKMEFRFKCNWTLKAIGDEFGLDTSTVSKYKARWKKKQERKDEK